MYIMLFLHSFFSWNATFHPIEILNENNLSQNFMLSIFWDQFNLNSGKLSMNFYQTVVFIQKDYTVE